MNQGSNRWAELARGVTDRDGRINEFTPDLKPFLPDVYRLRFFTAAYFTRSRLTVSIPRST